MQSIHSNGTFPHYRPAEIPDGYRSSVLRALPCNPTQLFVYWDLPPTDGHCTSISLSLFGSDVSRESEQAPVLEFVVSPTANKQYLTVPVAGMSCRVQLDATFTDGKHIVLLSEECIHLPSSIHSPGTPVHGPAGTPETPLSSEPSTGTAFTQPVGPPEHPAGAGHPSSWSLQDIFRS